MRSPDLMPLDYFLLEHMKDVGYWQKSKAREQLQQ
jgi:hypothetical protein